MHRFPASGIRRPSSFSRAIGLLVPLLLASPALAATWQVDPDGSGDATRIQAGLNLAVAGDTVVVACGTYHERQITLKDGVVLTSATGEADCVTVDAENIYRVFYASGVDGGAALIGFTAINGRVNYGGAMYCGSGSDLDIRNCVFSNNSATVGGGMYVHHSDPSIVDCSFTGNSSDYWGGGIAIEDLAQPEIVGCTFADNVAAYYGGGTFNYLWTAPQFVGCRFTGNEASRGGGIASIGGAIELHDTYVTGNAAEYGGGISLSETAATIERCTIANNAATIEGGGIAGRDAVTADFRQSILWGNCAPLGATAALADGATSVGFDCCDVDQAPGWKSGPGIVTWSGPNLFADPLFCGPADCGAAPTSAGEYGLATDSPGQENGSSGCGRLGPPAEGDCPSPGTSRFVASGTGPAVRAGRRGR